MILNYIICAILVACLVTEVGFILKRNKKMLTKGKDDFFAFSLIVFFALIIFPLSEMDNMVENIRNILLLVTIFGSAAIKRGFSEKGVEKVCYNVPWEKIQQIHIKEYQNSKMQVICTTGKAKHKLLFSKYKLKEVLRVLEQHVSNIYIQSSLQEVLNMKKG